MKNRRSTFACNSMTTEESATERELNGWDEEDSLRGISNMAVELFGGENFAF